MKDGDTVLVSFQNQKIKKVIDGLQPKCDNIIVGYGYDSSRVIRGNVLFTASAPYSVPRFVPRWLDNGVRADWYKALIFGLFHLVLFFVAFRLSADKRK